jgi:hypothetical protein
VTLFSSPALTAVGLRKAFGPLVVLDDIDLQVPAGTATEASATATQPDLWSAQADGDMLVGMLQPRRSRKAGEGAARKYEELAQAWLRRNRGRFLVLSAFLAPLVAGANLAATDGAVCAGALAS